jgi:hypothetical protein
MNTDTPLPPDEPQAENPPDGAMLDYFLGRAPAGPVTLEIQDAAGSTVRYYASNDPVSPVDPMLDIPAYWVRPPHPLSAAPGMHRFLWDMHYTPLPSGRGRGGYGMDAVVHDTPRAVTSMWVLPGRYTVKLTVDGTSYTQPLIVKMDPRVRTAPVGIQEQFTLSRRLYDDILANGKALEQLRALRSRLRKTSAGRGAADETAAALEKKAADLEGTASGGRGGRGPTAGGPETLSNVGGALTALLRTLQAADVAPTTQLAVAVTDRHAAHARLMVRWTALQEEVKRTNLP